LLSDPSDPEKTIELCKMHDVCEQYRLKVVALGRPLLEAEARMFERYDKVMKAESKKQRSELAVEKLSSQQPLDLKG
jgi:hypothetical protein